MFECILLLRIVKVDDVSFWRRQKRDHAVSNWIRRHVRYDESISTERTVSGLYVGMVDLISAFCVGSLLFSVNPKSSPCEFAELVDGKVHYGQTVSADEGSEANRTWSPWP